MFVELLHLFILDMLQMEELILLNIYMPWNRFLHDAKQNCEKEGGRDGVVIWPLRQTGDTLVKSMFLYLHI